MKDLELPVVGLNGGDCLRDVATVDAPLTDAVRMRQIDCDASQRPNVPPVGVHRYSKQETHRAPPCLVETARPLRRVSNSSARRWPYDGDHMDITGSTVTRLPSGSTPAVAPRREIHTCAGWPRLDVLHDIRVVCN